MVCRWDVCHDCRAQVSIDSVAGSADNGEVSGVFFLPFSVLKSKKRRDACWRPRCSLLSGRGKMATWCLQTVKIV